MKFPVIICVLITTTLLVVMDRKMLISLSFEAVANHRYLDGNVSHLGSNVSKDFALAYQQSGGFFDDISEREWKMMQQRHSLTFPNHVEFFENYTHEDMNAWYQDNFEPEISCRHEQRIGGKGEGGKWICDPHRIQEKKECLVYSIGCFGIVGFEKEIKELMPHCEIHVFDVKAGRKSFPISYEELVKPFGEFHHWGITDQAHAEEIPHRYKTVQQTIKELGHEGRTIDLFKIDCEGCEWSTYKDFFTSGVEVKQILVELHDAPMPKAKGFFHTLHDEGYTIFHKEPNILAQNSGRCIEYAFVKMDPEFFGNDLYSKQQSALA